MGATVVFVFAILLSFVGGLLLIPAVLLMVGKKAKKIHRIFAVSLFILSGIFILPTVLIGVLIPVQMFMSMVYAPMVQRQADGELVTAIKKNDYKQTRKLIEKGMPVNVLDDQGYSPLSTACEYGDEKMVELLLDSGADINQRLNDSQTPLHIATMYEKPETVRLLLRNKADVNLYSSGNFSSLMDAAISGEYDIAEQLIKAGIDVNLHNTGMGTEESADGGATALMYASSCEAADALRIIDLLLKSGAEVNAVDSRGRTPLIYACTRYSVVINPEIIRVLVQNHADIKLRDVSGRSASDYMAEQIKTQKENVKKYDNDYQKDLLRTYEALGALLKI